MILTCPACQTRYQADAAKFPPQGRTVRCARCGHVWHELPPEPEPQPEPEPELEVFVAPPPPSQPVYEREEPETEQYVQPPERDEEPQAEAEPVPEPVAHSPWPRRILLSTGWLGLGAIVAVILVAAVLYRQDIVQVWPQSASLYSRFGMKVTAAGLQIDDVRWQEELRGGQVVGTVTGALTNMSNRELPVPQIRVGLVDGDKRELYHWTFAPDVMTLGPGQSTHFVNRLSNPPEGARDLEVRFAKAGE